MDKHTNAIKAWIEVAVDCWAKDQTADLSTPYYAYYRAGSVIAPGSIVISPDAPNEHYALVTGERINPWHTPKMVKENLFKLCRGLPILQIGE